jgi:Protein of unknown function (DUF4232)
MKKSNLINRFLRTCIVYIFFFSSILITSAVNSNVRRVATKPVMLEKPLVPDQKNTDSLDRPARLSSKLLPCQTKQLSLRRMSVEGGMGHSGAIYVFTNNSSSTCTLSGYPGFVLLAANGRSLTGVKIKLSKHNYFHHTQQQSVSLTPSNRASFMVATTRINRSGQNCPVSAKVEITPPDTNQHFTITEQLRSCAVISITPIELGTIKY